MTLTVNDNVLAQQTILDDLQKLNSYLSSTLKPVTTGRVPGSKRSQLLSQNKSTSHVTPSQKRVSGLSNSSSQSTTKRMSRSVIEQKSTPKIDIGPYSLWTTSKFSDRTHSSTSKPSNFNLIDKHFLSSTRNVLTDSETIERPMQTTATADINPGKPSATMYPPFSSERQSKQPFTADSVVSKSLSALDNYLHGNLGFGGSDLNSLWREANTTIHPEVLLELERGSQRKKRQADGTVSMEQYCQLKGSKTQDGYLHMCSTCAVITKLPDHYFPRFVNEAVCKTGDSNCFVINGIPHGECRQRTITLNIMRKKPNKCLLVVHNGENIMIDDWELYPKTIRVSCECLIKKNSFLAPYVKGSSPHH